MRLVKKLSPSTKTLMVAESVFTKLKDFYRDHQQASPHASIVFFAKLEAFTISVYSVNEDKYKVMFQGFSFDDDVHLWMKPEKPNTTSVSHYGSDEVGTGDFFGPVVVTASLVQEKDVAWLTELGIRDSKLITDPMILKLADQMTGRIAHVTTIVNPLKYQSMVAKGYNLNEIKAKLHHHALMTLKQKVNLNVPMVIDQFASAEKFASYLADQTLIPNLMLVEKAESQFLAVAASSILARAKFIRAMNDLGRIFTVKIPFGASDKVEQFAYEFAQHHGLETLKGICKTNFKTLKRIETKLGS
jgi:ribonuclease HIII